MTFLKNVLVASIFLSVFVMAETPSRASDGVQQAQKVGCFVLATCNWEKRRLSDDAWSRMKTHDNWKLFTKIIGIIINEKGRELREWKHKFLKRLDMYNELMHDVKERAKVDLKAEDFKK